MKVLVVLVFMLGIFVTPVSAQQRGTLTFNGNVFDAPAGEGVDLLEKGLGCTLPE